MPTTTITADASLATLVDVFAVRPDRRRELVDLLVHATDEVMRHLPGFVAANIHASTDGTRVVNLAARPGGARSTGGPHGPSRAGTGSSSNAGRPSMLVRFLRRR